MQPCSCSDGASACGALCAEERGGARGCVGHVVVTSRARLDEDTESGEDEARRARLRAKSAGHLVHKEDVGDRVVEWDDARDQRAQRREKVVQVDEIGLGVWGNGAHARSWAQHMLAGSSDMAQTWDGAACAVGRAVCGVLCVRCAIYDVGCAVDVYGGHDAPTCTGWRSWTVSRYCRCRAVKT